MHYNRAQRWSFIGLAFGTAFNTFLLGANFYQEHYLNATINAVAALLPFLVLMYLLLRGD